VGASSMSSESDYAWRMARYYGPEISRMTRGEEIADLEALCADCHGKADQQREYAAGLATYARKKYGEYWEEDQPIERLEEEFDHWLEERNDDEPADDCWHRDE
jgi:hypothetical protein